MGLWRVGVDEPERVALTVPVTGNSLTFGELLARANRVARGFRQEGLEAGDGVAAVLSNCVEYLVLFAATHQMGLYLIPINHHFIAEEIAYILDNSEAAAIVTSEAFAPKVAEASDQGGMRSLRRFSVGRAPGFRAFEELASGQSGHWLEDRVAGSVMSYTSGTSGRPKGVRRPLSGGNPDDEANRFNILNLFGIESGGDGVYLCGSPLYHASSWGFALAALHLGHRVTLMDKWTPKRALQLIEEEHVRYTHMVPTQFARLLELDLDARKRWDLSSLQVVAHAGAPCPVNVKREMIAWFGPIIYEYYASSEGVGGTLINSQEALAHPGAVGRSWSPNQEILILDDDGQEVAPREVGTIYSRLVGGTGGFDYYKDPEKSSEARRGDAFTVGDLGWMDEDGYLYLVSRRTDLILSGGVNIYPAEIEGVLCEHPLVIDAAVFGIPNAEWGEDVKAVLQVKGGSHREPDLREDLTDWCRSRLASFKVPKSIDFVDELPRDPNGKLYKRRLREPFWAGVDPL
jgi:long-chain acyl-CoA synthetase